MGKNTVGVVLNKVFVDITNITAIIKDIGKIKEAVETTNFDNENEVNKVVEDTKSVINRLKDDVSRIDVYFDENYNNWKTKAAESVACVPDSEDGNKDTESDLTIAANETEKDTEHIETPDTIETHIDECNAGSTSSETVDDLFNSEPDLNTPLNSEPDLNTLIETLNDPGPEPEVTENCNSKIATDKETNPVEPSDSRDTKVFLKCIDIKKLTESSTLTNHADNSVMVISDSEPETDIQAHHKKSKKASNAFETIDQLTKTIGSSITISKINNKSNADITKKDDKTPETNGIQDKKSEDNARSRTRVAKSKTIKDPLKSKKIGTDTSGTESDASHKQKKVGKLLKKIPKLQKDDDKLVQMQKDVKFAWQAYVLLPHYRTEKLKELYLKKRENDEIRRLTDLTNLNGEKHNKRKRKDSSEKNKRTSKRKRALSGASSKTTSDLESVGSIPPLDIIQNDIPHPTLLSDRSSGTDAMDSDNKNTKKKKKETSDEKVDPDKQKEENAKDSTDSDSKKSSNITNSKKKSKWRRDKLLRKNAIEFDSESSEEEFEKFMKKAEKPKKEVKKQLTRTKPKKVINSDSDSDCSKKNTKKTKRRSESSASISSRSSSSSPSGSESSNKSSVSKPKKKGGRIKRVKESSSDENDKSTRKTIRKVIGHGSLKETTKQAEKEEKERKARIAERQKRYNDIFDADKLLKSTVDKLVLDFDENTKDELLAVDKDLVAKLKPHQATGIQFMWNACFESLERTKKTNGSGCILAHCMGLGKTLQVITLVHALLTNEKETGVHKVLVVCPVNTVLNWIDEFKKWLTDLDGDEIELYELVSQKQISYRRYLVKDWTNKGGVLVIGYDMFKTITNPTNKKVQKKFRETFYAGMVNPGPDLIICDEGHLLKNEKTNLSIAVSRVRTERRIVLTGTPMQNNLKEYYCMVQFVKPNLLGTFKEYLNRFVNPITNGQYTDSTQHDISIMRKRSHVLHKMLDGIVQRKDYDVLTPYLPPKYEYVVFTKLSEVQIKLYRYYLDNMARTPGEGQSRKTAFLFSDFQEFQRICTHPRVLLNKTVENHKKMIFRDDEDESEGSIKDFIDDEEDSTSSGGSSSSGSNSGSEKSKKKNHKGNKQSGPRLTRNSAAAAEIDLTNICDNNDTAVGSEADNWWRQFSDGDDLDNIEHGGKLFLLFEIIQQCELIGDKILIFSQSLYSLNIIEYFLQKIDEATQDGKDKCGFTGSWALGLDYFRIDGSSSCDNRAASCKVFNDPDNIRARLFLISTKAGGLGINLIGANRVVIFDVSWNPSHDTQSIYRVYRFGQTKPCYIYRFVTWGTMEMKIYERQVTKQAISKRVIDEQQIDRHYTQTDLAELYNFDPEPEEAPTPLLPKDILLAELLHEKKRIYKYHEHQTLLENKEEEELNEDERKAAWDEYEQEKTNPPITASAGINAGGFIKNIPLHSINAALFNILQKDNPTWARDQVQAVVPIVIQQLREQVDKGENVLFGRIVNELRIIQIQQQQKLQQYYMQHQFRMLSQQPRFRLPGMNATTMLNSLLNPGSSRQVPTTQMNTAEIVELND